MMRGTRFFAVGSILCAVATNIGVLIAVGLAIGSHPAPPRCTSVK
jgi:hypothetical protein